jgi:predicted SnoaL-like aldol condensation-catalyzing enzyme
MKSTTILVAALPACGAARAQLPVVAATNQEALLASADTPWFDMFRIENGKIAEHLDCAPRQ